MSHAHDETWKLLAERDPLDDNTDPLLATRMKAEREKLYAASTGPWIGCDLPLSAAGKRSARTSELPRRSLIPISQ